MTNTTCPATVSRVHDIEWMDAPSMNYDAGAHSFVIPASRRGFCWACDERFVEVAA